MRDRQETLPSLLAQLEIEYADGSQTVIVSDTSWKVTSKGPIIANNEFDGEEYDARLELNGWNKNGFDDSKWFTADVMTTPAGKLTVQSNPNLRIQEEIKPVSITGKTGRQIYHRYGTEYGRQVSCQPERKERSTCHYEIC